MLSAEHWGRRRGEWWLGEDGLLRGLLSKLAINQVFPFLNTGSWVVPPVDSGCGLGTYFYQRDNRKM